MARRRIQTKKTEDEKPLGYSYNLEVLFQPWDLHAAKSLFDGIPKGKDSDYKECAFLQVKQGDSGDRILVGTVTNDHYLYHVVLSRTVESYYGTGPLEEGLEVCRDEFKQLLDMLPSAKATEGFVVKFHYEMGTDSRRATTITVKTPTKSSQFQHDFRTFPSSWQYIANPRNYGPPKTINELRLAENGEGSVANIHTFEPSYLELAGKLFKTLRRQGWATDGISLITNEAEGPIYMVPQNSIEQREYPSALFVLMPLRMSMKVLARFWKASYADLTPIYVEFDDTEEDPDTA